MATSSSALNAAASGALAEPATHASTHAASHATSHGTSAARNASLTDDEILGIVSEPAHGKSADKKSSTAEADAALNATGTNDAAAEPAQFRAIFDANPSLRDAWRDARAFHEIFPDVQSARDIQKLFPTADDARAAGAQLADLAKLDTLFFSNRPESHAELAAAVYRLNPSAFRSLARMMQAISSDSGNSLEPGNRVSSAASESTVNAPRANAAPAFSTSQDTNNGVNNAVNNGADPAMAAQAAFFHETNAAAVNGVLDAIHTQVNRLLPDGTTGATRQRMVGEIYRAIDSAMRSNHAFGQQLRQAFRAGNWSAENRQAIAGMVVARARQALPGIAKKVINEWTSGVVAQSNARVERQRAAERRVDIAGGAPGGDGRRALSPRDIDYRRLSDADILNL
ncbi:MAG TPA: hypothetical protein VIH76_14235 [Candidatus Acidoferrales bacterium]